MPLAWAYVDTSVLVKRYVRESGSAGARGYLRRYRFLSSSILPVETVSALVRRRAAGDLAGDDFDAIMSQLARDRSYWELIEVNASVLGHAEQVIVRTGARTLDAIHLASALAFREATGLPSAQFPFITADSQQRDAATRLGFPIRWVG